MRARLLTAAAVAALSCIPASRAVADSEWFFVVNDTDHHIVYLFSSPVWDQYWSADLLGAETTLPAGEMLYLKVAPPTPLEKILGYCLFDIMVVYDDETEYADQIDICAQDVWIPRHLLTV